MGCYKIPDDVKNYAEAENDCVQNGGHLTSIHSQGEVDFLLRLIGPPDSPNHSPMVMLGGKVNIDQDQVSSFYWTDGSEFDYYNWQPGQPYLSGTEECIGMMPFFNSSEGTWFIDDCNAGHRYVCKNPFEGNRLMLF